MSNCQNVKISKCQNIKMSNCQNFNLSIKLSQYQMSCIIRVCRLSQRIDCVLIFSIFHISSPSDLLGHVLTHLRSSEDLSERELVNETICSIALSDVSDTVLFFLLPISFPKEIIYTNGTFLAKLISFKSLQVFSLGWLLQNRQ